MELRQYHRINLDNNTVHISDRAGFCKGSLKDCSRFGLCITGLPRKTHPKKGCFKAVVSCENGNFTFNVEEKWRRQDGSTIMVGANIVDAPWQWTEIIMRNEPGATSGVAHQQVFNA